MRGAADRDRNRGSLALEQLLLLIAALAAASGALMAATTIADAVIARLSDREALSDGDGPTSGSANESGGVMNRVDHDREKGSLALEQVLFIGAVIAMSAGVFVFYENIGTYFRTVSITALPTVLQAGTGGAGSGGANP